MPNYQEKDKKKTIKEKNNKIFFDKGFLNLAYDYASWKEGCNINIMESSHPGYKEVEILKPEFLLWDF